MCVNIVCQHGLRRVARLDGCCLASLGVNIKGLGGATLLRQRPRALEFIFSTSTKEFSLASYVANPFSNSSVAIPTCRRHQAGGIGLNNRHAFSTPNPAGSLRSTTHRH